MKNSYYINRRRTIAAAMSVMMIGSLAACGTTDTAKSIDSEGVQAASDEEELTETLTKSLGLSSGTDASDGVDKEETVLT